MNQDIRQILANNIKNLRTQKKLSREKLFLSNPNSNKKQIKPKTAPKQENYNEEAENALF